MDSLKREIYALTRQGLFDEALSKLAKLESDENRMDVWRLRASVYYDRGSLEETCKVFAEIIKHSGGLISDFYLKGLYGVELGDYDASIRDLEMANELEERRHPGEQFTSALFWIVIARFLNNQEFDIDNLNRIGDDYEEHIFGHLIRKKDILRAQHSESGRLELLDKLAQ